MKYNWWCNIRVEAKDGVVVFERGTNNDEYQYLPFVPVAGMKLTFGEDKDTVEFTIKSVCWCLPQNCFWITLEDDSSLLDNDCPCTGNGNCCVILHGGEDSHRGGWIEGGWTIHEEWKWEKINEPL